MRVKISEDFKTAFKRLKKRHKSLQDDFERLLASLIMNPEQGVELIDGVRKIRLAITSKGRGKSGGACVIIRARIVDDATSTTRATTRTSQMPSSATS